MRDGERVPVEPGDLIEDSWDAMESFAVLRRSSSILVSSSIFLSVVSRRISPSCLINERYCSVLIVLVNSSVLLASLLPKPNPLRSSPASGLYFIASLYPPPPYVTLAKWPFSAFLGILNQDSGYRIKGYRAAVRACEGLVPC